MTSVRMPICMTCQHYRNNAEGFTCEAFPDGIPPAILSNSVDHRRPVDGDGGIQYKPQGRRAAAYADDVFGIVSRA